MTDRKGHREAYELVAELEYLAIEAGLKIRIVDSVRELKEEIQGPLSDEQWQKTLLYIEETVAYVEKQIFGNKKEIVIEDAPVVSEEEVREKIRKIWFLTAESVKELQAPYRQEQAFLRLKQEADMIDLTNVRANYEIMSDPARFNAKFHESGQIYKQQSDKVATDYVNDCAGEYARAMDRIKGVISTIDRGQSSVTSRDIYEKWDKKQEMICQGLRKNAEQLDKGESEVSSFGQEHMKTMGKIVRKKKRKRLLYIWLPLIIILVVTAAAQGISYLQETFNPPAEETVQEGEPGFGDQILSQVKDKAANEISNGITKNLFSIIKGVLIPVFILISIGWILWAFYTKKLYQSWLAESLEKYLRPYAESFQRENRLLKKEEDSFKRLEQLVLECYDKVFRDVFEEVFDVATEESPEAKMKELRRKWNGIRYL